MPNADLVILVCQMKRSGSVLPVVAEDLAGRSSIVLEAAAGRSQAADELSDLDPPESIRRRLAQVEVQVQNVAVGGNVENRWKFIKSSLNVRKYSRLSKKFHWKLISFQDYTICYKHL